MIRQIRYGFQYEYPLCCILWFVTGYHNMRVKGEIFSIVGKKNLNEYSSVCDRIMCPNCIIKELCNN